MSEITGDIIIGAVVTGVIVGVLHVFSEGIAQEAFKKARRKCPCPKRHKRRR